MTNGLSNLRDCQWRAQLTTLCPGGKGECGSKVLLNFVPQPYALTSSRVHRTTYLMLSGPSGRINCALGQPAVRRPYNFERAAHHTWKNVEPYGITDAARALTRSAHTWKNTAQHFPPRRGHAAASCAGVPAPEACDAQAVARGPIKQVRRCVRRVSDVLSDVLSDVVKTGKMLVVDKRTSYCSLFLLIGSYV